MTAAEIAADLETQLTTGYKHQLPISMFGGMDGMPMINWRANIELMLMHPVVKQALRYFKAGIAGAEFWGGPNPDNPDDEQGLPICEDQQIGRFVKEQAEKFWDKGVPHVQDGYEYGWIGGEHVYTNDGVMKWDSVKTFAPQDTFLLTRDNVAVGIRVNNVDEATRPVDLWLAGKSVPAKGMWYAHNPRYNSFYGQSQLMGSWRPWRRAAWKDGAETVLDLACYRWGIGPIIGRYPDEDLQGPNPGPGNTTADSQGNQRRFARDIMRQIVEQSKSGSAIGLPSTRDKDGNYKWDIDAPTATITGLNNLIEYIIHLYDQIYIGIGVPPELIQAAETGSGYSGRRIPRDAFLSQQQQLADAILQMFIDQVLRPLVRWNFGDGIKFNLMVKSLIKTQDKETNQQPQPGQPGQMPQPGVRPAPVDPRQQQVQQYPQAMLSLVTDAIRDKARRILLAA